MIFKPLIEEPFRDMINEIADSMNCRLIIVYIFPQDSMTKKTLLVSLASVEDLDMIAGSQKHMVYDRGFFKEKKIILVERSEKSKLSDIELICASILEDVDPEKAKEFRVMRQLKGTSEYTKRFGGLHKQKFRYSIAVTYNKEYEIEKTVKTVSICGFPVSQSGISEKLK